MITFLQKKNPTDCRVFETKTFMSYYKICMTTYRHKSTFQYQQKTG
jgi:hypothetical protein